MSDTALSRIAACQAGAFSLAQSEAAGFTKAARRHNLAVGRWIRLHQGVFAFAGSPDSPERRLWAAKLALGPEAVASHRSALWLWGIGPTKDLEAVEFSVPPGHSGRRPGIVVHKVEDLSTAVVSIRRGILVTNPLRTLVDAGAVLEPADVLDALDRAISRKLVTPGAVLAEVRRLSKSGRDGVGVLRRLLLGQGVGANRSPSYLEAKALRLFKRAGLPPPTVELKWGDHGQFRLDFTWEEYGVVVEVDGWDCHSSHRARQHDLNRRNQIVLGNLRPLIYTYGDIVRRGDKTIREILELFDLVRRRVSSRPLPPLE